MVHFICVALSLHLFFSMKNWAEMGELVARCPSLAQLLSFCMLLKNIKWIQSTKCLNMLCNRVSSIHARITYSLAHSTPGFIIYSILVSVTSVVLIYYYSPKYGKSNPLVYITICSLVGSISVMACKAFGIALKLTFSGSNQFIHPSTYVFIIVVVTCIMTQMNYFNKALDKFSTSVVTPIYYVFFTTATIGASVILFRGLDNTTTVQLLNIVCGFLTIFIGVFLLNTPKAELIGMNMNSLKESSSTRSPNYLRPFDEENLGYSGMDDDSELNV